MGKLLHLSVHPFLPPPYVDWGETASYHVYLQYLQQWDLDLSWCYQNAHNTNTPLESHHENQALNLQFLLFTYTVPQDSACLIKKVMGVSVWMAM